MAGHEQRSDERNSRRTFLKKLASTSALAAGGFSVASASEATSGAQKIALPKRRLAPAGVSPNDRIGVAAIGMGAIGFANMHRIRQLPDAEFVAAADCYEGRCIRTREVFGDDVDTTWDYRELLGRSDVDAVIVNTPDHWHAPIAIEAMRAGKAVHIEKPMVHELEEGLGVIEAHEETGRVCQVGSEGISSAIYAKAKALYEAGAIGRLNMVKASINRNSAIGAWQYSIPLDASPETIAWERFLGPAPDHAFDADRFFRWRKYWDYGTGIPGDLFVHLFTGIHHVVGSNGPTEVMSTGTLSKWKEKREVPDIVMGLYTYPETESHPAFTLSLDVNFAYGAEDDSGGYRFIGDEGVMTIGRDDNLILSRRSAREAPGYSIGTFSEAMQERFLEAYHERYPEPDDPPQVDEATQTVYTAPEDALLAHFENFFAAMRTGQPIVEDPKMGFRAAAPALLSNRSYREGRLCRWDPEAMKLMS